MYVTRRIDYAPGAIAVTTGYLSFIFIFGVFGRVVETRLSLRMKPNETYQI
jgi:hypothetical protein